MLYITYRPAKYEITFKGHANSGEKGQDIICAAASMGFYNLAAVLSKCPEKWFWEKPDMADYLSDPKSKGVSHIRCIPSSEYEEYVLFAFQYAVTGFEQLAANYPEYIALKITEK